MMTEKQVWPEATFRVKVRLKKHKTQGQMLADFSEAVIAKRRAEVARGWGLGGNLLPRQSLAR